MSDMDLYKILENFDNLESATDKLAPVSETQFASDEEIDSAIQANDYEGMRISNGWKAMERMVHRNHRGDTNLIDGILNRMSVMDESQTKVQTMGNKVRVTTDGDTTEFDDAETAKAMMGTGDDENSFTTEAEEVDEELNETRATPKYLEYHSGTPVKTVDANGNTEYRLNGKLHREDGPALINAGGYELNFLNGHQVSRAEVEHYAANRPTNDGIEEGLLDEMGTAGYEDEGDAPEFSTFDSENELHRKRLQRGTPVVLSPEVCSDPSGVRTGVFVNRSQSGFYGTVIRDCDGKQINVHLSDIVSADITNNSIYEAFDLDLDALLEDEDAPKEKWGVFSKGGSIGSNGKGKPVATFDNAADAKEDAKRRRKGLSKGEKSYYGMGYNVKKINEGQLDKDYDGSPGYYNDKTKTWKVYDKIKGDRMGGPEYTMLKSFDDKDEADAYARKYSADKNYQRGGLKSTMVSKRTYKKVNEDITITQTTNPENPENDTTTVTAVGNDAADELAAMMQNAGLDQAGPAAPAVDTGEPEVVSVPNGELEPLPMLPDYDVEELAADCTMDEDFGDENYDARNEFSSDGDFEPSDEDLAAIEADPEWDLEFDESVVREDDVQYLSPEIAKAIIDGADIYDLIHDESVPQKDREALSNDINELMLGGDNELTAYENLAGRIYDQFGGMDEARDIEHANTPDEMVAGVDVVTHGVAGGLNRPKRMHKPAAGGDNPIGVWEEYDIAENWEDDEDDTCPNCGTSGWNNDEGDALCKACGHNTYDGYDDESEDYDHDPYGDEDMLGRGGIGEDRDEDFIPSNEPDEAELDNTDYSNMGAADFEDDDYAFESKDEEDKEDKEEVSEHFTNEHESVDSFLDLYKAFSIRGEKK